MRYGWRMKFWHEMSASWREFRSHWPLFLALHVLASLFVGIVLGPLLSLMLGGLVMTSGDAALTDQDILLAMLSPLGFVLGLVGVALALTVAVFETAAMLMACHALAKGKRPRLGGVLQALVMRLRGLFRIAIEMAIRVLVVATPFLAVAGFIFLRFLTEFDINYYLAERPPEFFVAGGLIGVLLLVMAVLLLRMASGWFLALPLALLGGVPAAEALSESQRRLRGHRGTVIRFLLGWAALFALAYAASGGLLQLGAEIALDLVGSSLQALAWSAGGLFIAWSLLNLLIALFATVSFVLAVLAGYRRLVPDPPDSHASAAGLAAGAPRGRPVATLVALLVIVGVIEIVILRQQFDEFQNNDRPDVVAHRGASWGAPENTMAAFEAAIEQGADWVEIDVQETHDGRVLVIHDRDLMKVGGSPLRVFDAPFEELRAVDIGSWKDPRYADQRVPLLSEVLDLARGRVKLNIELKYYGQEQRLEQRVAELVEAHGMVDDVVIMSLSLPAVRTMKSLRPDWTVGLLSSVAVGDVTRLDADFFAINAAFASRQFVERAQGRGKGVLTWTVNDPAGMSAMIGKRVDGIITDRPGLANRVWEERGALEVHERLLVHLASRLGSDYGEAP